jgi:5-methylcytosine-specific restriction endonuclease McrA
MGKRLPNTPRSKVRAAIRQLWLRSRERAAALKRDQYTCQRCGVKQSKAKGREQDMQVHHCASIGNWEAVIDFIFAEILCSPEHLETVCPECHKKEEVK